MAEDIKKKIRPVRNRTYLNKDFDGFRADLIRYARTFFPDRIRDFSEASMGGMLVELAAYVGDVNSFYLDHQFGETSPETSVEDRNTERHIRASGVEIVGKSPAVVENTFYVEIPAEISGDEYRPQRSALPKMLQGSIFKSKSGVTFELTEDVDYAEVDENGDLTSQQKLSATSSSGIPTYYVLIRKGLCVSGTTTTQTFRIQNSFVPFRTITLSHENVTDVISVTDSENNKYYQVGALTQDVVFRGVINTNDDSDLVKEGLELLPAPYRYLKEMSFQTGLTSIRFGGGQADSLDDDIIPDPSDLALPLYGKKTFQRMTVDPNSLLQTQTLGIAPVNTTITVQYRHGGGLSHNVSAGSIRNVGTLLMTFPGNPSNAVATKIRSSLDVKNEFEARGGEDAPSLDELRSRIPAAKASQSRIVTREDLLARIYTMPSNFGRIFRAGIRSNPSNPLSTQLFIISRNKDGNLVISPDTLKNNVRTYINQFRLISDAVDILDAAVVNVGLNFTIVTDPNANKGLVIQNVISELKSYFKVKNFNIDQPLSLSDVTNIIINTSGVISLVDVRVNNIRGTILERNYSDVGFDVGSNTVKGFVIGPPGSMFEIRYPNFDIVGNAL